MMTIIAIGIAAIAALSAFRSLRKRPDHGAPIIHGIRHQVSVVAEVDAFIWNILDALEFLTKPRGVGGQNQIRPLGMRIAADVRDDD